MVPRRIYLYVHLRVHIFFPGPILFPGLIGLKIVRQTGRDVEQMFATFENFINLKRAENEVSVIYA